MVSFDQRGHFAIERLLKTMIKDNKPLGFIGHRVLGVHVCGYVATVYTIETIEEPPAKKNTGNKRQASNAKQKVRHALHDL